MYFAQIKDGYVINVIVADNLEIAVQLSSYCDEVIDVSSIEPRPEIGWLYSNNQFSAPSPKLPSISPRQVRLALVLSGISLETIESAIDSLSEPEKTLARISWEYAVEYERENPIVNSLGLMLGFTSNQIDELWAVASTL